MVFNMDKCLFCMIMRKCNLIIYDYNMRGKVFKRVEVQCDFGVFIICDVGFNEYIYVQVNKVNKMLGFICCIFSSRSVQFLLIFRFFYVVFVCFYLEYVFEIWSLKFVILIKFIEGV